MEVRVLHSTSCTGQYFIHSSMHCGFLLEHIIAIASIIHEKLVFTLSPISFKKCNKFQILHRSCSLAPKYISIFPSFYWVAVSIYAMCSLNAPVKWQSYFYFDMCVCVECWIKLKCYNFKFKPSWTLGTPYIISSKALVKCKSLSIPMRYCDRLETHWECFPKTSPCQILEHQT